MRQCDEAYESKDQTTRKGLFRDDFSAVPIARLNSRRAPSIA
jgi:hypothetical protein